jgi:indolepyruvate decarboxylase
MQLPPPSSIKIAPKKMRRPKEPTRITVGQYLCKRLEKFQIRHIFGEKDESLQRFLKVIEYSSNCQFVEPILQNASGTMAHGYARKNCLGALLTTKENFEKEFYSFLRQTAENVPVVTILGTSEKREPYEVRCDPFSFNTLADEAKYCFEKNCKKCFFAYAILDDPQLAARKIDRTIDLAIHYQKPVCFELPDAVVESFIPQHEPRHTTFIPSDPESLRDAYRHLKKILGNAQKPFICIGREVATSRVEDITLQLAEKLDIPIFATPLGRGVVDEENPLFKGMFPQESIIEEADCELYFGLTLESLGFIPNRDQEKLKHKAFLFEQDAIIDSIRYPNVSLYDLLAHLSHANYPEKKAPEFVLKPEFAPCKATAEKITLPRLVLFIQNALTDGMLELVCDPECLFHIPYPLRKGSVLTTMHSSESFCLPAALGATLANPDKRPLIIIKEAAFQSSFTLLSTSIQHNLKPIIILLTEAGKPKTLSLKTLPDLFRAGKVVTATTEEEFEKVFKKGLQSLENFFLIKTQL